jgi:hypothetical protein
MLVAVFQIISEGPFEEIVFLRDIRHQFLDIFEGELFNVLIVEVYLSRFSLL